MPRRRVRRVVKEVIVKQQTTQPRQGRRPRRRPRARRAAMRAAFSQSQRLAASMANPWEVSSCIPDGSNGVGCFSVKQTQILGTGTGGSAAGYLLNPQSLLNNNKADTLSTSATPTLAGNYSSASQQPTIIGLYSAFRPVSAGMKVRYVGNTQTDQGILLIGQVSDSVAPNSFNNASLNTAQNLMQNYKIFPLRSGGTVTWRPQAMDDQEVFSVSTGTVTALTVGPGSPWLIALIYGANAATASLAIVDTIVNYEGQYNSQTFLPGGLEAVAPVAESGWYEKALNLVRSVEQVTPFVASTLTNVMNSPYGAQIGSAAATALFGATVRRGMPRLDYMSVD